jgi:hypothetical protein
MKLPLYLAAVLSLSAGAFGQTTALTLARQGDKVVPPQARDQITGIYSEKTDGTNAPEIWHIGYFDPTAALKATEVTFVDGKVKEVTHPKRVFDVFTGGKQMAWKKLRIDSDRALLIALQEPMVKKLQVRAVQLWLERTPVGASWRIRIWAARPGKPDQTTKIGDLFISSKTGEVLKNELRPREPG